MKKSKTQLRKERREKRHYGMTKIREGQKAVFMSVQNKHGWSLGLALNSHTIWLRNVRFQSRKDVEHAMEKSKLVFVHLKNNPKK